MAASQRKPTDFIIKVYESKALADIGDEHNALFVFNNGLSSGTADPAIGNAAQVISGTTTSVTTNKIVDTSAKFGSRLVGKKIYNANSFLGATETGKHEDFSSTTISARDSATQLTLDDNIFGVGGIHTFSDNTPTPSSAWEANKYFRKLQQTSTSGSGTGAEFVGYTYGDGNIKVYVMKPGVGYDVGDTIVITDPNSTSNTATLTVASLRTNNINYFIEAPGNFFTFQKYYYRFESSDTVVGFEIDWDDGEDNSPEKANRQTIKLDVPQTYAVVPHTYTTHGKHYPMIRTISPAGFKSKWYTTSDAATAGLTSIEVQSLSTGQNDYSKVSIDSATTPRIPEFMPANSPPIGVLKTDRKTVYSGIDNDVINSSVISNPQLYFYIERKGGTTCNFEHALEVTWLDTADNIVTNIISAHSTASGCELVGGTGTGGNDSNLYVKKLLGVKIINLLEGTITSGDKLGPDERVYCHVFPQGGTAAPATDPIVTIVSLGNPIQYLNRPGFSLITDGSQSQTRCSNVSISKYIYDEGKLKGATAAGAVGTRFSIGMPDQISDIIGDTTATGLTNAIDQNNSYGQFYYTHSPNYSPHSDNSGNAICSKTKRFFNEERLIRLQVVDSSVSTRQDSTVQYTDSYATPSLLAEDVTTSETAINVSYGDEFKVGDVISMSSTASHEQMLVTKVVGDTITVTRRFNGATAITGTDKDQIYKLYDGGRLGDSCTHSFIEHWEPRGYSKHINRPDSLKSTALLQYGTALDPSADDDTSIDIKWRAINFDTPDGYRKQTRAVGSVATDTGEAGLIFGGAAGNDANVTNYVQLATNTWETGKGNRSHEKPNNFLLACKDKKFNRIHLRMKNDFTKQTSEDYTSDALYSNDSGTGYKTKIVAWYSALTSPAASTYEWKPLPIVDTTAVRTHDTNDSGVDENTSLRRSGSIYFDTPQDWEKVDSNDLSWDGAVKPVSDADASTTTSDDPEVMWSDKMYGLLLGIVVDVNTEVSKFKCVDFQTYNNSHSTTINIIDPHHKSLNEMAIAQSISWSRSGTYDISTSRIGSSEIKKMGAAGGSISFGSIELSGNYSTQKKIINIYQREGTPVYLDIERARNSGEYIRFYGVITSMTEDYPTGLMTPKFGLSMAVSHLCEMDSSGEWIGGGLQSLGGELIDVPKYT